jgi:predicted RNase H-like nuclease (RuvC/YqgF family)
MPRYVSEKNSRPAGLMVITDSRPIRWRVWCLAALSRVREETAEERAKMKYPSEYEEAGTAIREQAEEIERLKAERDALDKDYGNLVHDHQAEVSRLQGELAQAKRLYDMTLANEQRWMRLHESAHLRS